MTCRALITSIAMSVLVVGAQATAQAPRLHIGPHFVVTHEEDENEFGVGVHMTIPVIHRLEFYPSFEWYSSHEDEGLHWAVSAEFKYRLVRGLYGGAGITMDRYDRPLGTTDAHENLILGFESLRGKVHPFAEARAVFGYADIVYQLKLGLNITLGKH